MLPRALAGLAVGLVLAAALAFRLIDLDHVPGINADEAHYGAQVLSLRAGQPTNLRTTVGKPPNPVYMGPLYLLHLVAPAPAFWKLRAVAVLSGIVTLVMGYWLVARLRDRQTGLLTVLLLACLPTAIVYSRLGWDPCQVILVGLLCLYFVFERRLLGAIAALVIGLLIHPTNIFLVPILLGPVVAEQLVRWRQAGTAGVGLRTMASGLGLAVAVGVALALVLWVVPADVWLRGGVAAMFERLVRPSDWSDFALALADLFTGTSVYRHVAGPPPSGSVIVARVGLAVVMAGLLLLGIPRLVRRGDWPILGMLGGLAASLVGFFVVAGPGKMAAGWEWYGLFAVAPAVLGAACLLRSMGDSPWAMRLQLAGTLAVGALLLGSFYFQCLRTIWDTGGDAGRQFRTGSVDPKQQAFEAVADTVGDAPMTILAEDWWSGEPIHYLSMGRPDRIVTLFEQAGNHFDQNGRRLFLVGFAGSPCHEWLAGQTPKLEMRFFADYVGRPVLYMVELTGREKLLPELADVAATLPSDTRAWPQPREGPE